MSTCQSSKTMKTNKIVTAYHAESNIQQIPEFFGSFYSVVSVKPGTYGIHEAIYLKHLYLLAVAREMHRGNSWVYDHHDAAIKKLDKILVESDDSEAS